VAAKSNRESVARHFVEVTSDWDPVERNQIQ